MIFQRLLKLHCQNSASGPFEVQSKQWRVNLKQFKDKYPSPQILTLCWTVYFLKLLLIPKPSIKPIAFCKGEVISRGTWWSFLRVEPLGLPCLPPPLWHCNFDGGSGKIYGGHFWLSVQECVQVVEEMVQVDSTAAMFILYSTVKSNSLNI